MIIRRKQGCVVRNSEKRIFSDLNYMHQDSFLQKCRILKENHFTRKRKMPLSNLLLSIPFRKGRTLYVELKYFKEIFKMQKPISKPGYLKQRLKLNPEVFRDLLRHHAKNFFKDTQVVKKWKEYLVLAIDGSSCNVPLTPENVSIYGDTAKKGGKERPQVGISCLFDVCNRIIIDMSTAACKFDERAEAIKHLGNASDIIGKKKSICIFDRGYPSGIFFMDLMERNQLFIIRLGSTAFGREQKQMTNEDQWMDIIFDKSRIGATRRNGKIENADRMEKTVSIRLRFVRLTLDNGNEEYLITNLSEKNVTTKEMQELYHMRWEIESAYDDMKNKLQMENFTGSKPIIIEQDVYATGYLYNIMSDIIQDTEKELENQIKYKHKMQINRNIAAGVVKEEVIKLVLEQDANKQQDIMDAIILEIKSNLLPVRVGRSYKRSKGQLASNYSNVRKKSY